MKYLFILIIICSSLNSYSQVKSLEGRIMDAEHSKGIPYASVTLINSRISVVANLEGSFRIADNFEGTSDTLLFSSIGYTALKVPVKAYKEQGDQLIVLRPAIQTLQEVIVRPEQVTSILAEAVAKSDARYPAPVILKGYYRETVKVDSSLSKYSDGMIDYYITRKREREVQVMERIIPLSFGCLTK